MDYDFKDKYDQSQNIYGYTDQYGHFHTMPQAEYYKMTSVDEIYNKMRINGEPIPVYQVFRVVVHHLGDIASTLKDISNSLKSRY